MSNNVTKYIRRGSWIQNVDFDLSHFREVSLVRIREERIFDMNLLDVISQYASQGPYGIGDSREVESASVWQVMTHSQLHKDK